MQFNPKRFINETLTKLSIRDFEEWLSVQSPSKSYSCRVNTCPLAEYIKEMLPAIPGITLFIYNSYFCVQHKSDDVYYAESRLPTWAKFFSTATSMYTDSTTAKYLKVLQVIKTNQRDLNRYLDSNGFVERSFYSKYKIHDIFYPEREADTTNVVEDF